MSEANIIVIQPGVLTASGKRTLARKGIVVIEHKYPGEVRLIHAEPFPVSGNTIARLAIEVLAENIHSGPSQEFVRRLAAAMKEDK